jgi:hypothetical protein
MKNNHVNAYISKLIEIFRIIYDKDLFEIYYREALAKRILKID